jgi:ribulose-5-phosphate 4-epimerase/fuculose-1-phosphate aldolase
LNLVRLQLSSIFNRKEESPDVSQLQDLISANHILHHNKVVDAYGHVSLRHPSDPTIFIMSGDKAPALVSSPIDLIQYYISDSSPVDPKAKKGYQERFIHSEIYKRYPHINSVVHSHSEAVLPFTMNGVPMKPAFHIAGFLGRLNQIPGLLNTKMTLAVTLRMHS